MIDKVEAARIIDKFQVNGWWPGGEFDDLVEYIGNFESSIEVRSRVMTASHQAYSARFGDSA